MFTKLKTIAYALIIAFSLTAITAGTIATVSTDVKAGSLTEAQCQQVAKEIHVLSRTIQLYKQHLRNAIAAGNPVLANYFMTKIRQLSFQRAVRINLFRENCV